MNTPQTIDSLAKAARELLRDRHDMDCTTRDLVRAVAALSSDPAPKTEPVAWLARDLSGLPVDLFIGSGPPTHKNYSGGWHPLFAAPVAAQGEADITALLRRVPLPPNQITYEKGWELIDALQALAVKVQSAIAVLPSEQERSAQSGSREPFAWKCTFDEIVRWTDDIDQARLYQLDGFKITNLYATPHDAQPIPADSGAREAFEKALQAYENGVAERAALAEHDIGGGADVGMLRARLMILYDARPSAPNDEAREALAELVRLNYDVPDRTEGYREMQKAAWANALRVLGQGEKG